MNYANLIQNITENIKTNGSQAITAQVLQDVLVDMVGELGQSGALLGGVIDTSFVPDSTNDAQVVYIAESPGTYTNFNGLVVGAGEVAFFYFDGNAWAKSSVDVLEVVNDLNSTATDKALSAAMGKQLQDSLTQAVNDLTTAIGGKADTTYVDSQLATKADTATVNAALANKADTSYVNTQLATKADATATSTALAGKADKVAGAVAGNMASLDASGNLVDSGINSSAVGDVANKIDRVVGAEVGNVAAFDAIGGIEDSGVAADNIAEQDGYYETMVVGGAENLIGSDIVASQFTRRKTGGSTDVGTGVAILKTIKGNTLVWNQQVQNGDFSNGITGWDLSGDSTATISDGVTTIIGSDLTSRSRIWQTLPTISGHKYLVTQDYFVPTGASDLWASAGGGMSVTTLSVKNAWTKFSAIFTADGTSIDMQWRFISNNGTIPHEMKVRHIILTDLTQMFGSGNEPTAAEFEALFPLNYYAYNTGSLLNLTATGLQTNGFNQWDEEWESGNFNATTGANVSSTTTRRSKNYIPVFGGQAYYFYSEHLVGVSGNQFIVGAWDAEKNYIGLLGQNWQNTVQTLPANCAYVRFYGLNATFDKHICINLSDVNKNGTYEPYWSETKVLPITTATSGGVAIFSDGMKSAGTAYDRYYKSAGSDLFDKGQVVIGKIKVSDITDWTVTGTGDFRSWALNNIVPADSIISNIVCDKYTRDTAANVYNRASNKIFFCGKSGYFDTVTTQLVICDTAYSTVAAFVAAMGDTEFYFELATPTDYTLDTPFNTQYKVDNDGTETILPENTSTPTTSPIVADINYALNAIDTIRNLPQNYISKASMDAILTAFKTAGVITNYTLTWDATNQKYNCTITA